MKIKATTMSKRKWKIKYNRKSFGMRNDEFCNIFSNQQQEAHSNRAKVQYNVSYIIDCFNKNEPESMIEANKNDIKNIEMIEKAEIYAI